ncbi:MAG TPA: isoprenylcysteine carboxylmethyltransferase family protein [Roseiarcus sp.]|nr:isoprenylcysteine carboxylmethyltransferase family protein [Roseiarcus sp.]
MLVHWLFLSLFVLMWGGWLAVWNVMARRAKVVAQSESAVSRLTHVAPLLIAAYLLVAHVPLPFLNERFVPLAVWSATLGAALTFAGLAFAIWARFIIAGNWSSYVELKQDHELIVAGPYQWVRHPIYTGLLLAFIGSALAVGEWRGALAVAIVAASFWRKLRLEETVMRRQFGEAYARYAARVPALIPFVG